MEEPQALTTVRRPGPLPAPEASLARASRRQNETGEAGRRRNRVEIWTHTLARGLFFLLFCPATQLAAVCLFPFPFLQHRLS